MRGGARIVDAVEAAYRVDLDDDTWLRELTDIVEPLLTPESGTVSYFIDLVGPRTAILKPYVKNARLAMPLEEMHTFRDLNQRTYLMTSLPASTLSGHMPAAVFAEWQELSGKPMGIRDSIGLAAINPDGKGVVVSSGLAAPLRLEPKRRLQLSRLSAHIATAHRLRRHLAAQATTHAVLESGDAVLSAEGRIEDAQGAAKTRDAQAWLRRAARAVDRARSQEGRSDPERALSSWHALVDGRWSLVDQFDTDGRRYWIAHPNAPHAPDPRRLTLRERQVLAYAAMGRSQKQIAYELGVSLGTVGNHLRAGMRKLGVASRSKLVQFFASLWMKRVLQGGKDAG